MTNLSSTPPVDPVRVSDLGELLAGLPVLFGFRPVESLIVVCIDGPRGRVGFRVRADLPPLAHRDELADYLLQALRRNAASTVLVVARSDRPAVADPMVAALLARLRDEAIEVRDAVRCDGSRYWSYLCDTVGCCPPEGREYDEGGGRLLAEAVLAGMEVLPDRAALGNRVGAVAGPARERMTSATAMAAAALLATLGDRDPAQMQRDRRLLEIGVRRVTAIVDAVTDRPDQGPSDAEAAELSVWCSLTAVRDAAWARITTENAADRLRVWSQVARKVVPPYELPVLALAGFSAWLSGDGALAWCAIERADEIDPDDTMTDLLRGLLVRALPPSTWVPPPKEPIWDDIALA